MQSIVMQGEKRVGVRVGASLGVWVWVWVCVCEVQTCVKVCGCHLMSMWV